MITVDTEDMKFCLKANQVLMIAIIMVLLINRTYATDYYVSALTGSDYNNGLTPTTAYKTIQKAADQTNPGDIVYIMNGTYNETNVLYSNHATVLYISRSGSDGAYITFKNYAGHNPVISGVNCRWSCVLIRANYIRFEGIELEGPNQNITYEQARAMYDYYVNTPSGSRDWNLIGTMNTGGIGLGGDKNLLLHHIEIRKCKVHDFQGGGIGGSYFDYLIIENNIVYNNSWYGMYATSGISVFHPQNTDNNTDSYKLIVRGNICYNNKTLIPWAGRDYISDGNGIIIDDNKNSQITGGIPYTGRTLVENNISYNNGGSGIHAYSSNNVDIINNTAYNNGTVVGYPEIYGQDGTNVNIYNNIMYARTGGACNSNASGTTYDYNIYFNGPAYRMGANDIIADPKFVKIAKDSTADFRLRKTSIAINSGCDVPGRFSTIDINGMERPVGAKPDRGAFESPYTEIGVAPEMVIKQGSRILLNNQDNYSFGDVFFNQPKTITFTILNNGGAVLQLTGSPRIIVSGDGYSMAEDAPEIINPGNSATFQIKLTTSEERQYNGIITINCNDEYENPFVLALTGNGKSNLKAVQTISFNALPLKFIGDSDFYPEAVASSGLPVTYTSSVPAVAVIVDGKIRITGQGTTIITASQAGDANTHPAEDVSQGLTVIPAMNLSPENLVSNPTFNNGTEGWSFAYQNSGSASVISTEKTGYSSNVGKVSIISTGSTNSVYNVQFGTNVPVVAGKQYAIFFKASADANRMVSLIMIRNVSPWTILYTKNNVSITTIPTTYGPFLYNSTSKETLSFRLLLGSSDMSVYIDDVEVREVLPASSVEISHENRNLDFELYPNPASDKINILIPSFNGKQVKIRILNLNGLAMISQSLEKHPVDDTIYTIPLNLNPGIYIVEMESGNIRKMRKLLVIQ